MTSVRVPTEPLTRIGLALFGGFTGLAVGALSSTVLSDSLATTVACGGVALFSLRGLRARVVGTSDEVSVYNLWTTRRFGVETVEELTLLRHAGLLKANTPALRIRGRRLRVPMYGASTWGSFWGAHTSDRDRRVIDALVRWADLAGVPVAATLRN